MTAHSMPKDESPDAEPMTMKQRRRPWWVGPGVGAVVGAAVIAVAAQGSLAAGHVDLPVGPKLRPAVAAPGLTQTATPAGSDTVVAPVHAVITQSEASSSSPVTSPAGGPPGSPTQDAGNGGAASESSGPGASPASTPGAGTGGAPTDTTEATTTTSTVAANPPPTTTSTTRPTGEPGDT